MDPTVVGTPLRIESDSYAAQELGRSIRPARVDGVPGVWLQAGTAGCLRGADEPGWCGAYLLGQEAWDTGTLGGETVPRFRLDDTGEFNLVFSGVTLLGGPDGEGLVFLEQEDDVTPWSWRLFDHAPELPATMAEATFSVVDLAATTPPDLADVDGDGVTDVLLPEIGGGLAFFVAPEPGDRALDDADWVVTVTTGGGVVVRAVTADLDGDGHTDAVYVDEATTGHPLRAKLGPLLASEEWGSEDITWQHTVDADELGEAPVTSLIDYRAGLQRVADVTGDGREEVLVGSQRGPESAEDGFTSYLIATAAPGVHSIADAIALPADNGNGLMSFAGAEDVDGDGLSDLLLHPRATDGDGWIGLVFLGPVTGGEPPIELTTALEDGILYDLQLGAVGDLDGDGVSSWIFVDQLEDLESRAWLVEGCGG